MAARKGTKATEAKAEPKADAKADSHDLTALVNVPAELYGGKPGERTNTGQPLKGLTKTQAAALKKSKYAE